MIIVDRLITGGIRFVLERVAAAVDAEMTDDSVLREELLAAQMKNELGEISDEEYEEIERHVLAAMRKLRERRGGDAAGPIEMKNVSVDRIEADVGDESAPKRKNSARR